MEPALQKTKKLFFIKPEIAIVNLRPWQPANAMHTQEATKGVGMQHEFVVILKIKYFLIKQHYQNLDNLFLDDGVLFMNTNFFSTVKSLQKDALRRL